MKYLEWDSSFFGKDSFRFEYEKSRFSPKNSYIEDFDRHFGDSFISCKLNTKVSSEVLFFLQKCGFDYLDTEIKLRAGKYEAGVKNSKVVVKKRNHSAPPPFFSKSSFFEMKSSKKSVFLLFFLLK